MDVYLSIGDASPEIEGFLKGESGEALKTDGIIQDKWINFVVLGVDSLEFIDPSPLTIHSSYN